jgi:hypothetical protein
VAITFRLRRVHHPPVTPDPGGEPLTLAELMPAPARRRFPWKVVGAAVAVLAVFAAVGVFAYATRPGSMSARTIGPSRADAVRECRAAVESEAQRRVTSANSGSGAAAATVGGVDMADPMWSQPAWRLDATIRFTIVSIFGQTPATVYVRCTASRSGGRTLTSIAPR